MKHDDLQLITKTMDGDDDAYGILIDRYKNGLYRHCFRFVRDEDDAEDLAQQAFIEAFVHLDSYNPEYRFSTWLYKIATNLALTQLRKRRAIHLDDGEIDRIISTAPGAEELAFRQQIYDAVDTLPVKYRTVIAMYYWQGKSYSEIASSMNTTTGSIKGWMSRAKQQLKEILS